MKDKQIRTGWLSVLLGATIFLSSFLLFQIQPLLGRYIVPWFGGTPEVWTTCMMFFQIFLLGAYAYAHALNRLSLRAQMSIHGLLTVAAVSTLSIIPDPSLQPDQDSIPILRIIWICMVCVGGAYFVLAATSPLLQSWFSRTLPGRNPYRLYALSNIGSLLALGSFPFLFETLFKRDTTARFWAAGFWVYAVLTAITVTVIVQQRSARQKLTNKKQPANSQNDKKIVSRAPLRDWFLWIALPMTASVALLAVTNKVTLDIAVIPFLWVLPLCLYLFSFVLCFDHPRWYRRNTYMVILIAAVAAHIWIGQNAEAIQGAAIVAVYAVILFCCCMICHGELYQLRPHNQQLTGFYLMIAIGGAAGGIFVALIGPLVFSYYQELWLSLLATILIVLLSQKNVPPGFARRRRWWAGTICIIGISATFLRGQHLHPDQQIIYGTRNFFGILTVIEESREDHEQHKRLMQHGSTYHGLQFMSADRRDIPTTYYSPDSGIGLLLRHWPTDNPRRIGGVGLGVGTIATYGRGGDIMRFYEINPAVDMMARKYFTYLEDSDAEIEVVLGDARLSMEHEPPQQYDVLVLDAFSNDSIPVHLLTRQAFDIYLSHLAEGGVLAIHISTRYLDLQSVVWKLADTLNLHSRWIREPGNPDKGAFYSSWILLAKTREMLDLPPIRNRQSRPYADLESVPLWTDDHVNLLRVFRPPPK